MSKAKRAPKPKRLKLTPAVLREARAILAVAALHKGKYSMSYYRIADDLGLDRRAADAANIVWMDANGPVDWTPKTEEKALVCTCALLQMDLDA